jgi:hypothetical protein
MFDAKKKYAEFLLMNREMQLEFIYAMKFVKDAEFVLPVMNYLSSKPIEEYSFGLVKSMMDAVLSGKDGELPCILSESEETKEEYSMDKILRLEAWKVLRTFESITDTILTFMAAESEMLQPIFPNKYKAQSEQINFEMFDAHFMQRDSLAGGDILKYDEVDKLPYSLCIAKLTLDQKRDNLQELVLKQSTKG